jgi:hypothetical protein
MSFVEDSALYENQIEIKSDQVNSYRFTNAVFLSSPHISIVSVEGIKIKPY